MAEENVTLENLKAAMDDKAAADAAPKVEPVAETASDDAAAVTETPATPAAEEVVAPVEPKSTILVVHTPPANGKTPWRGFGSSRALASSPLTVVKWSAISPVRCCA